MNKCVICGETCSDEEDVHQDCHDRELKSLVEETSETQGMSEEEIDEFYEEQAKNIRHNHRLLFTSLTPC